MQLNIFKSQATIDALTADNKGWADKYQTIEKQLTEAQDTIGNFMAEKEKFNTQLETLKKEHQAEIDKLTVKNVETVNSVNEVVTTQLASLGVPEGAIKEETTKTIGVKEALETLKSLKGKQAQDFYAANKQLFAEYIKSPKNAA